LLKNLGVAPRDAMEILGHSRISVTLEIYTDGDEDTRRRALGRLSEQLGRNQRRGGTISGSSRPA